MLSVVNVQRGFGGVKAVDGATFSAMRGHITGLIGPNGAGKSTLIAVIGGALKPEGGSITVGGRDITGMPAHQVARQRLIRTFQRSAEVSRLRGRENLRVAARRQDGVSLCCPQPAAPC